MHRFSSPSIPLSVLLAFAPAGVLAAIAPKEVHQVLPLDAKGELSLATFKGTVKATAWDRAEVKLDASIQADESSDCGTEQEKAEWVRRTEVKIETAPGSVRLSSDYDQLETAGNLNNHCVSRPFVNYEIKLPVNARLRIADHKSTIQVADVQADPAPGSSRQSLEGSRAMIRTAVAAAILGAICATAGQAQLGAPDGEHIHTLQAQFEHFRKELKIPGLAVIILQDRKVVWKHSFGYADVATKRAYFPETPQHVASLTKTFAATLVLQLVERGELRLNEAVADYVPEVEDRR